MQEKKIKGIKRHFLVDVLGLILFVVVHAANIQERAGAKLVLTKAAKSDMPRLETILADDGYSGKPMADYVREEHGWRFVSVKRPELHKFQVMPKRWVVERTIGWMNNFRGLSKHYDYDSRTGEAKILLASICYMTKRLTSPPSVPIWSLENDDKLREKLKTLTNPT
jgi:Transposase and inactivated derivatives